MQYLHKRYTPAYAKRGCYRDHRKRRTVLMYVFMVRAPFGAADCFLII